MNLSSKDFNNLCYRKRKKLIDLWLSPGSIGSNVLTVLEPLISSQCIEILHLFIGELEREKRVGGGVHRCLIGWVGGRSCLNCSICSISNFGWGWSSGSGASALGGRGVAFLRLLRGGTSRTGVRVMSHSLTPRTSLLRSRPRCHDFKSE